MKPYCYPGAKRLAAAASMAGFRTAELPTIVGISGQETSGNVWAVGGPNNNGSFDYGAWQINLSAHAPKHPDWFNGLGLNVMSYVDNAKMAYAVYVEAGHSFRPWVAYTHNRYNSRTAPYAHTAAKAMSWLDWGMAGTKDMMTELAAGRPLEAIASIYFP